jgi:MFS family permease
MFLVAWLLFVPLGGLYVFAGYQGAHLGMSNSAVGLALGWSTVMGLAGGTAAAWMCTRWGPVYPIVSTCVLAAATCVAIGMAAGAGLFVLAFVLFGITYMFAMTTIASVCAAADSSGRAAVLVGLVFAVAVGSVLVGYLLDGERPELAWQIGALACAVATIPAALSARTVNMLSLIMTRPAADRLPERLR